MNRNVNLRCCIYLTGKLSVGLHFALKELYKWRCLQKMERHLFSFWRMVLVANSGLGVPKSQ